jgi:hypothetical protein
MSACGVGLVDSISQFVVLGSNQAARSLAADSVLPWYEMLTARKQWQTTDVQCPENHNTAGKAGK